MFAIRSIQGKKTPGLDGIPIEFYWKFNNQLVPILTKLYNSFSVAGKMHDSAYQGVISLLYKGKGDRNCLSNWRPLTMLNLDYKIYAKVLSRRVQCVIASVVHTDQSCAVPGRTILDSIFHVQSVIDFAKYNRVNVNLLSLDHKAAFDVLEWEFIFCVLRYMNFGDIFINHMKCIYSLGTCVHRFQSMDT